MQAQNNQLGKHLVFRRTLVNETQIPSTEIAAASSALEDNPDRCVKKYSYSGKE
jgi:hypothetical protein